LLYPLSNYATEEELSKPHTAQSPGNKCDLIYITFLSKVVLSDVSLTL